tara:strand:- start:84 stop:389 length:306 start_codon:yes stop_codon:yes gene_type:complete
MSAQPFYDANNPEHVRKAELKQEDIDKDIEFILSKDRGRRWLYNLIWGQGHIASPSHMPGDVHGTAFNEGARSFGVAVHEEIRKASPKMYMKMLEENHFNE